MSRKCAELTQCLCLACRRTPSGRLHRWPLKPADGILRSEQRTDQRHGGYAGGRPGVRRSLPSLHRNLITHQCSRWRPRHLHLRCQRGIWTRCRPTWTCNTDAISFQMAAAPHGCLLSARRGVGPPKRPSRQPIAAVASGSLTFRRGGMPKNRRRDTGRSHVPGSRRGSWANGFRAGATVRHGLSLVRSAAL